VRLPFSRIEARKLDGATRSAIGAGLPSIESATTAGGVDGWLGVDESEVAGSFAQPVVMTTAVRNPVVVQRKLSATDQPQRDVNIAFTYSRVIRAIFEIGISFGHTASHSPSLEQLPKPSASACSIIATTRR